MIQMKVIINAYSIRTVSCERIVQPFFLLIMCSGLGLGDILKLDLITPLIETLPLEEGLTSHLPEV